MQDMDALKKEATDAATGGFVDSAVDKATAVASPYMEKLKPVFAAAETLFVKAEPYIEMAFVKGAEIYQTVEPYHPEELLGALVGFILCFYGGAFCTTIAAVEAFRMCGYSRSSRALGVLVEQYKVAEAELRKDDDVDADADGVADNKQRSTDQLVKRKIKIALKTCDPAALSDGLQGLYAGLMAVIATLQLRFAQVLTLGASLGDGINSLAERMVPSLQASVDPEYRKWVPQVLSYVCKALGVTLAWLVQRVIFGFTTAMKGGQMLCRSTGAYLVRHEMMAPEFFAVDSPTYHYVELAVCAIGFYAQFSRGFGLGWMAVPLFPISCFEWGLGMVVGKVA